MDCEAKSLGAEEALARLREGNEAFATARQNTSCIDAELRGRLAVEGQRPYAAVLACSDSRVVPEDIFMTGLGELFTVRVAGNVAGDEQVASVAYAASHLGTRLVVVLGHSCCGAVGAVLSGADDPAVAPVTDLIAAAIGEERGEREAAIANVRAAVERLCADPVLARLAQEDGLRIQGAYYHTDSGEVEWL